MTRNAALRFPDGVDGTHVGVAQGATTLPAPAIRARRAAPYAVGDHGLGSILAPLAFSRVSRASRPAAPPPWRRADRAQDLGSGERLPDHVHVCRQPVRRRRVLHLGERSIRQSARRTPPRDSLMLRCLSGCPVCVVFRSEPCRRVERTEGARAARLQAPSRARPRLELRLEPEPPPTHPLQTASLSSSPPCSPTRFDPSPRSLRPGPERRLSPGPSSPLEPDPRAVPPGGWREHLHSRTIDGAREGCPRRSGLLSTNVSRARASTDAMLCNPWKRCVRRPPRGKLPNVSDHLSRPHGRASSPRGGESGQRVMIGGNATRSLTASPSAAGGGGGSPRASSRSCKPRP